MSTQVKKTRIPLRLGTRVSDVKRQLGSLGFELGKHFARSADWPAELVWTTSQPDTTVHLIDDQYIYRLYVVVRGPNAAEIAEDIRECNFSLTVPELLRELQATAMDDVNYAEVVTSLALATQDRIGEETVAQLRKALDHVLPSVRIRTLEALSYTDDPAYRRLAHEVLEHDRDERVRSTASALLSAYQRISEP